ncbi:MAG: single-stranded-DNA-specific exonuclease RecJ [Lachnospiraceae bacterium]|nr:single-stranded-DNA-specific exonuclease RecJ [Lachnospiraceae bacterium]
MRQWVTKRYQADLQKIAERYQISDIVAEVLVKRGLFDWNAMDRYLFPDEDALYDTAQMKDMQKAAFILRQKIDEGKLIKVIGDYDVDGVMSTYILYRGITLLGGKAGYRIPHRVQDGYGMRSYMAEEAAEEGYDTIITCDNGISAVPAVKRVKELGLTMIVTDHHEVPREDGKEVLPPADAIVNPKQEACGYPFQELCGAGIAYKLVSLLFEESGMAGYERELLPFAAIATVCDVVPLFDENRILVKSGLECLEQCHNLGMRALIDALQFHRKINAGDLGFRIGPCINAAGRLDDAVLGLELLLEQDAGCAREKAMRLVALNEERKDYTAKAVREAVAQIENGEMLKNHVLVIYIEDCHESVAGIVAGRIREKYYRPTLIVTKTKEGLKGSARSIPGYHMQQELNHCRELLKEYGGHAMAAGFSLESENLIPLRQALNNHCSLSEEELIEKISFDREVPLGEMQESVVQQLAYLEPFGQGNQEPVFAKRDLAVVSLSLCGKENQIARVQLRDGMRVYRGVDFQCELHLGEGIRGRYGDKAWEELKAGRGRDYEVDILYQPEINQMFGNVEFRIIDCR